MLDKGKIESYHKGDHSHPGKEYEWVSNIPTDAEYKLKEGEIITVGKAFDDKGNLLQNQDSLWKKRILIKGKDLHEALL